MSSYKYCFVPMCSNTSVKTPEKLFFSVPKKPELRAKWCKIVRRKDVSVKAPHYVCEDHFNVAEDVQDYARFKFLKKNNLPTFRLALKPGTLPHKFDCQPGRTNSHKSTRTASSRLNLKDAVQQPLAHIQDMLSNEMINDHPCTVHDQMETEQLDAIMDTVEETEPLSMDASCQTDWSIPASSLMTKTDASCQVNFNIPKPHCRSKSVQVQPLMKSIKTSPIKFRNRYNCNNVADVSGGDLSDTIVSTADSSFRCDETFEEDLDITISEDETAVKLEVEDFQALSLKVTQRHMSTNPRLYMGIDVNNMKVLEHLESISGINRFSLFVVLRKLRLNESLDLLADLFGCSKSKLSRIISSQFAVISAFFSKFVFWPERKFIKRHVPVPFRLNFSNVESILDCFEIEIEKPSDAEWQALTWSSYKHCNTVKYLISSTPNGFINFVSKGFGGRASDIVITENCGYLQELKPGTTVMADRGFKNVESLLNGKDCSLVRPPSVSAGVQMSAIDVKRTRIIASLRIHIERVIRRLREFELLAPHSCFHHSYLNQIDNAVVLACGLSNLQGPLIL